jgi:hypothetical protein
MKRVNRSLAGGFMLSALLLLFSCKKQINEPAANDKAAAANEAARSLQAASTDCKPAVFGVITDHTSFPQTWGTIAQKWYSGGMVSYMKVSDNEAPNVSAQFEPGLNIEWAEVTYQGNQVYVRDVMKDRMVMRVTLDAQGRPAASYLNNQTDNADNSYSKDTAYYYYTGDRLDSIVTLSETRLTGVTPFFHTRKFKLMYDMHGNISQVDIPVLSSGISQGSRMLFKYDYSKPVDGIINNYRINVSQKLLEYLELLTVPMHHAVTEISFGTYIGPPSPMEVFNLIDQRKYEDYVITDGLVHSYTNTRVNNKYTFYSGWECGAGSNKTITTLDQFLQRYPGH